MSEFRTDPLFGESVILAPGREARVYRALLGSIAAHQVGDRPDRYEPRLKKRRRNYYDWLTRGPKVTEFENALAAYCGVKYAVAVNSATSALHIACLAAFLERASRDRDFLRRLLFPPRPRGDRVPLTR